LNQVVQGRTGHRSNATLVAGRGGLAPQILVGFFLKGPQKKKGNKEELKRANALFQTEVLTKKKKGHAGGPPI
jgi:hypothetical protein